MQFQPPPFAATVAPHQAAAVSGKRASPAEVNTRHLPLQCKTQVTAGTFGAECFVGLNGWLEGMEAQSPSTPTICSSSGRHTHNFTKRPTPCTNTNPRNLTPLFRLYHPAPLPRVRCLMSQTCYLIYSPDSLLSLHHPTSRIQSTTARVALLIGLIALGGEPRGGRATRHPSWPPDPRRLPLPPPP